MPAYIAMPLAFLIGFGANWCWAAGSTPTLEFGLAKAVCTMAGSLVAYYCFYR